MNKTTKNTDELIKDLQDNPELKAFFNQQVHLLAPLLMEEGTCGINVELPNTEDLEIKRVNIFYDVKGEIIESSAEGRDIYQITIEARENMEDSLNKIINLMDDSESDPSDLPQSLH